MILYVHKSKNAIPVCTSKIINRFFPQLGIFKNRKYQNQKILSSSCNW
jgi:hypothetical protein